MAVKTKTVFELKHQQSNVDNKLVVAFEKMSEVFRVLLWNEGKALKLSPIQLQILIFIRHHASDKCKVGYLAKEFNLTKPTVSDSIKVLVEKGYIYKILDENDSRSYSVSLTSKGDKTTDRIEHYPKALQENIADISEEKKSVVLETMMELLHKLQNNGVIERQRMCFNCDHYDGDKTNTHHCRFLKKTLTNSALRIDCPEFDIAS